MNYSLAGEWGCLFEAQNTCEVVMYELAPPFSKLSKLFIVANKFRHRLIERRSERRFHSATPSKCDIIQLPGVESTSPGTSILHILLNSNINSALGIHSTSGITFRVN